MKAETDLIEKFYGMSPEMQGSLVWIADHIEFVHRICSGETMPKEKWERDMELAVMKRDSLGIALLVFKHIQDRR